MSTLYIQYPQSGGGGGSTGSQTGVPYVVGPLDGAATNPQGGTIGSFSLYLQSATTTFPGLVNSSSQTFGGSKNFASPLLLSDGIVTAPGLAFTNEATSGLYRLGAGDVGLTAGGALGIEVLKIAANQINVGIGGAALNSAGQALLAQYNINAGAVFQYYNASVGGASYTALSISNGAAQAGLNLESHTYQNTGYLAGASLISAGSNNAPLFVIANEFQTTPNISFLLGGRTSSNTSLVINQGGFSMYGITSGIVSFITQSTSGTWGFYLPTTSGIIGQTLINQGSSSAMIWGGLNQMVGSVSLASQVTGNLPVSQTSGSISLTTQVSGVLPNANMSAVNLSTVAQVIGSLSLTGQVTGILPVINGGSGFGNTNHLVGSITFTQATGGNTYSLAFPSAVGTSSWVLQSSNGLGSLSWAAALTNPMTSSGDMIIGSGSGVAQRLALGNPGQVLTVSSGTANQAWASTIGTPGVGMTVVGIPNGSFPTAGTIGEVNTANPGGTSAVGGSGAFINLFNGPGIALSPGDWDVEGTIVLTTGATTAATLITGALSLGSASLDLTTSGGVVSLPGSVVVSTTYYLPTGKRRISIGSTTSVYLVGRLIYTVAGGAQWATDSYFIARRVR